MPCPTPGCTQECADPSSLSRHRKRKHGYQTSQRSSNYRNSFDVDESESRIPEEQTTSSLRMTTSSDSSSSELSPHQSVFPGSITSESSSPAMWDYAPQLQMDFPSPSNTPSAFNLLYEPAYPFTPAPELDEWVGVVNPVYPQPVDFGFPGQFLDFPAPFSEQSFSDLMTWDENTIQEAWPEVQSMPTVPPFHWGSLGL